MRSCSACIEGKELAFAGNVGTGFNDREIDRLLAKLKPLERDTPPFEDVPKMPRVRKGDVVWVEPKLVAEVEFVEWTHDGRLRAPSYQGLREDKAATDVHREESEPMESEIRKGKRSSSSRTSTSPSGPRKASPRAICSRTTDARRRCSFPISRTGRSR